MEAKHTPGPWHIEKPRRKKRQTDFQKTVEHGQEFIIMTPCGHRAGIVNGPSNIEMAGECVANAQLCAAAPDLLAALKSARLMLYAWRESRPAEHGPHPELDAEINRTEAIIAKAEGRA